MTQRMKDKIVGGLIGTASGVVVGLVLFFFGGIRTEAQSFKDLVNEKVDKGEFMEFKEENKEQHLEIVRSQDEKNAIIYDDVKYIRGRVDKLIDLQMEQRD